MMVTAWMIESAVTVRPVQEGGWVWADFLYDGCGMEDGVCRDGETCAGRNVVCHGRSCSMCSPMVRANGWY